MAIDEDKYKMCVFTIKTTVPNDGTNLCSKVSQKYNI